MQETTAEKTPDEAMFDKDIRGYDSLGELADLLEVSIENITRDPSSRTRFTLIPD
jgi:hypothetical protein